jgi:hypothetical protein
MSLERGGIIPSGRGRQAMKCWKIWCFAGVTDAQQVSELLTRVSNSRFPAQHMAGRLTRRKAAVRNDLVAY